MRVIASRRPHYIVPRARNSVLKKTSSSHSGTKGTETQYQASRFYDEVNYRLVTPLISPTKMYSPGVAEGGPTPSVVPLELAARPSSNPRLSARLDRKMEQDKCTPFVARNQCVCAWSGGNLTYWGKVDLAYKDAYSEGHASRGILFVIYEIARSVAIGLKRVARDVAS